MRSPLRNDKNAIDGLPLELLVICVVIAIVVPTVWGFSGMYIRGQTENDLIGELEHLKKIVDNVGSSEVGNIRIIELDLAGHPMARIDYVEVGGEIPISQYARYRIDGREENTFHLDGYHITNMSNDEPIVLDISGQGGVLMVKKSGRIHMGAEIIEIGFIGS